MEISVTVWGDLACFTSPTTKVERLTQPFPTPSAARGILSSIYCKPKEFHWEITRIEVLKPIRYISFKRNEVKCTLSSLEPISADDERTQRQTVFLYDVRYRITARIVPRSDFQGTVEQLYAQKNALGLALMLQSHLARQRTELEKAAAPAGGFHRRSSQDSPAAALRREQAGSCYICRQTSETMERYLEAFFYLLKKDLFHHC